ncbi:MAG: iron uptake transporter permease EfeU [Acidimicrobiia bacterium]
MFSNFLIGLREGLEAALVVGILVAYLVKIQRRDALKALWLGVGIAVGISLAFGAFLTFTARELSDEAEEAFAGIMSILAVVFVTGMIFWMRRAARELKHDLHGRLDRAVVAGSAAIALTAAFAVGREGLETALFFWTNAKATGSTWEPIVGGSLGLATSIVVGYFIYRGAVRVNLATFFAWTGAALVVIAAGVLAYGVHDLQEAGLIPFGGATVYDISSWYSETSWYGTLLKGIFNFSADATVLEVVVYFAYLVPTMTLFLIGLRAPAKAPEQRTPMVEPAVDLRTVEAAPAGAQR